MCVSAKEKAVSRQHSAVTHHLTAADQQIGQGGLGVTAPWSCRLLVARTALSLLEALQGWGDYWKEGVNW